MKYLEKLINQMKSGNKPGFAFMVCDGEHSGEHDHRRNLNASDQHRFCELIKKSEFIMFEANNTPTYAVIDETEAVDLPFQTCYIEVNNGVISSISPEDRNTTHFKDIRTVSLLINEPNPLEYEIFALMEAHKPMAPLEYVVLYYPPLTVASNNSILAMVQLMMKRFGNEKMGNESVNLKYKIGSGKEKEFIKIRRIIRITPKKYISSAIPTSAGRVIDWSHRFNVRGAWRRFWLDESKTVIDMTRVGKDRADNYVVKGSTWVRSYDKNKDKPVLLFKKTRIVL